MSDCRTKEQNTNTKCYNSVHSRIVIWKVKEKYSKGSRFYLERYKAGSLALSAQLYVAPFTIPELRLAYSGGLEAQSSG